MGVASRDSDSARSSPRWQEILDVRGYGHELRAALVDASGQCWGALNFQREPGHPFTERDVRRCCSIGFVVGGVFLAWRWPRVIWVQLPAMVYGALIEFVGFTCPLTPLQNYLQHRAGEAGYSGGFISHYLIQWIYPAGLHLGLGLGPASDPAPPRSPGSSPITSARAEAAPLSRSWPVVSRRLTRESRSASGCSSCSAAAIGYGGYLRRHRPQPACGELVTDHPNRRSSLRAASPSAFTRAC